MSFFLKKSEKYYDTGTQGIGDSAIKKNEKEDEGESENSYAGGNLTPEQVSKIETEKKRQRKERALEILFKTLTFVIGILASFAVFYGGWYLSTISVPFGEIKNEVNGQKTSNTDLNYRIQRLENVFFETGINVPLKNEPSK